MEQLFVGLTGHQRGGKGTFYQLFREMHPGLEIGHHRFSEPLQQILEVAGLPFVRPNTDPLARLLEELGGPGTVSRMTTRRAAKDRSPLVFLDGIRWFTDVHALRQFPHSMLVYITADVQVRYQRAIQAAEKPDEAKLTFAEFQARDRLGTEKDIADIGEEHADYIIYHNSMDADFAGLRRDMADVVAAINTKLDYIL